MNYSQHKVLSGLERLMNQDGRVLHGEVTAVDEGEYTCTVKLANGLELKEVQLKALKESSDAVVIIPKTGSDVTLLQLGRDHLVISVDEVEKVKGTIETTEFVIDADGYQIKRGGEDLKKILEDLIDTINQLTVPTSAGPSGVPINAAAFTAIKNRIPNLLT